MLSSRIGKNGLNPFVLTHTVGAIGRPPLDRSQADGFQFGGRLANPNMGLMASMMMSAFSGIGGGGLTRPTSSYGITSPSPQGLSLGGGFGQGGMGMLGNLLPMFQQFMAQLFGNQGLMGGLMGGMGNTGLEGGRRAAGGVGRRGGGGHGAVANPPRPMAYNPAGAMAPANYGAPGAMANPYTPPTVGQIPGAVFNSGTDPNFFLGDDAWAHSQGYPAAPHRQVTQGNDYQVSRVYKRRGGENGGGHHAFITVRDAQGNPMGGVPIQLTNSNGEVVNLVSSPEGAVNHPLWKNDNYSVRVGDAEVTNINSRYIERPEDNENGNSLFHFSWDVDFTMDDGTQYQVDNGAPTDEGQAVAMTQLDEGDESIEPTEAEGDGAEPVEEASEPADVEKPAEEDDGGGEEEESGGEESSEGSEGE